MRRVSVTSVAVLVLALALTAGAQAVGFGIRLSGGMSRIAYGDYNDFVDDVNAQLMLEPSITGSLDELRWMTEFGGEGFISILPMLDLAVGVGMLSGKSDFSFAMGDESMSFEHRVKSYPVTATVYAKLPLPLGTVKPFVFAGGGAYPTTITFEESLRSASETASYEAELSKTGFGIQGGVGLAIGVMPNMNIELSFRGRYAKLTGFEGTATNSDGETMDVFLAKDLEESGFRNFGPESVDMKDEYEEASVDLSGFSFSLGLTFAF